MKDTDVRKNWERYGDAWKDLKLADRLAIFKEVLAPNCKFSNPVDAGEGWDQLNASIEAFQKDVPGGWFDTIEFITHHGLSLAKWNLMNGQNQRVSEGYSVAEFGKDEKIVRLAGYWQT